MKLKFTLIATLFLSLIMINCSSDSVESIVETEETEKGGNEEESPIEEEEPEEEEPEVALPPVCEDIAQIAFPIIDTNTTPTENKCDVFLEENGIVVMEAENTKSDLVKWVFKNSPLTARVSWTYTIHETRQIDDHKGTGYIGYTGNWESWNDPEKVAPLKYTFKVTNPGTYKLYLRSFKKLNGEGDKHNDCFILVEGDFTAGTPNICISDFDKASPPATNYYLNKKTKFFGGSNVDWVNNGKLDAHSIKPSAVYAFKANETYTLTVTGRSTGYHIDRILFVDLNKY